LQPNNKKRKKIKKRKIETGNSSPSGKNNGFGEGLSAISLLRLMQTLLPQAPATASTRFTGLPLFFSSFPFFLFLFLSLFLFLFSIFFLFLFFLFFISSPSFPHLIFLFALYKARGKE
jgi:hypothetical protein